MQLTKRPSVQEKHITLAYMPMWRFRKFYHFLFVFPIFVDAMSVNLNNLTTRDILFGMENKTNHVNEIYLCRYKNS